MFLSRSKSSPVFGSFVPVLVQIALDLAQLWSRFSPVLVQNQSRFSLDLVLFLAQFKLSFFFWIVPRFSSDLAQVLSSFGQF